MAGRQVEVMVVAAAFAIITNEQNRILNSRFNSSSSRRERERDERAWSTKRMLQVGSARN